MLFIFTYNYKFQRFHLKKGGHHIYLFFHCRAKNKDMALELGMGVVCMHLYNIYSGLLDKSIILDFIGICF